MPTPALEERMKHIEAHPERHNQGRWLVAVDADGDGYTPDPDEVTDEFLSCGTASCLAGSGVIKYRPALARRWLTGEDVPQNAIRDAAMEIFGLTTHQAYALFAAFWTPEQLRTGVDALYDNPDIDDRTLAKTMTLALNPEFVFDDSDQAWYEIRLADQDDD